tara:strand:+ start:1140 stop:1376 length:237 start_codon:yes stop_codon:yes gene_type:complete
MTETEDIKVGGLVLCRKICPDKTYIYRWIREDRIYHPGTLSKVLRWVKEFFRPQWNPVGAEDVPDAGIFFDGTNGMGS